MLGSLLSPKLGLTMIKPQLEKQFGKKISEFKIILNSKSREIFFQVEDEKRKYDNSEALIKLIDDMIKKELSKTASKELKSLDFVIINYTKEKCTVDTYYTDIEENKTHKQIEL